MSYIFNENLKDWNPYYVIPYLNFYLKNINIKKDEVINNNEFCNQVKQLSNLRHYQILYNYLPKYIKQTIYDSEVFSRKYISKQTYTELLKLKEEYEIENAERYILIKHDIEVSSPDFHEFLWKVIKHNNKFILEGTGCFYGENFNLKFENCSIISTNITDFYKEYRGNNYSSKYDKIDKKWQFYISFEDEEKYLIINCNDVIMF